MPQPIYERLRPNLELVPLKLSASVYEVGAKHAYVYFPTDSIISLLYVMKDARPQKLRSLATKAWSGFLSSWAAKQPPSRVVVQSAGSAYRLRSKVLLSEFEFGGALQHLLLRYTQALITQMAQTAVCNRHHAVEQQLCWWLLLSMDRLPTNMLTMTQDLIANMLGVRREGVTAAAGKLQEA